MTRQKGKRWKRGEACVSNPVSKKHRVDAANVVRSKRQKVEPALPESAVSSGLSVALKDLDDSSDNLMKDDQVTHISGSSFFELLLKLDKKKT